MTEVIIYCDGACLEIRPWRYAALLMLDKKANLEKVVSGMKL